MVSWVAGSNKVGQNHPRLEAPHMSTGHHDPISWERIVVRTIGTTAALLTIVEKPEAALVLAVPVAFVWTLLVDS